VNVVRLNCQLQDGPTLLFAFLLDQSSAVVGNRADEHGLAPLGRPHPMIDNQVQPVFVALVAHACLPPELSLSMLLFDIVPTIHLEASKARSGEKPALPLGLKAAGLRQVTIRQN
jgi:hypothetical protein